MGELQRIQEERSSNKKALKRAKNQRKKEQQFEISQAIQILNREEAILRRLADSLAWVLLGSRRWEIRRLWQGGRPPSLATSNVPSLEKVLDTIRPDELQFALMSDLTSSIQLGDLVWTNYRSGQTSLVEVKEGATNFEILEFMKSFQQTGCVRALQFFKAERTESEFKQFERVLRQHKRMSQAAHFTENDSGIDPRTGERMLLSKDVFPLEFYEEELSSALLDALATGSSSFVIDECLQVIAHRRDTLEGQAFHAEVAHSAGHFLSDECLIEHLEESEQDTGVFRWDRLPSEPWELSRNLYTPDIQPLFLMNVPPEALRAVAFGHLRVAFILDVTRWMKLIEAQGVKVNLEDPSKREKASQHHKLMLLHQEKYIAVTNGAFEVRLGSGYKVRMALEAARPASLAKMIASTEVAPTP